MHVTVYVFCVCLCVCLSVCFVRLCMCMTVFCVLLVFVNVYFLCFCGRLYKHVLYVCVQGTNWLSKNCPISGVCVLLCRVLGFNAHVLMQLLHYKFVDLASAFSLYFYLRISYSVFIILDHSVS